MRWKGRGNNTDGWRKRRAEERERKREREREREREIMVRDDNLNKTDRSLN